MKIADLPRCGRCNKILFPSNARIRPELFLCDACLTSEEGGDAKMIADNLNKSFKRRFDQLREFIDLDAPDAIVQNAMLYVWETAILRYPELMDKWTEHIRSYIRVRASICPRCGEHGIKVINSHMPMCEECEKGLDDWIKENIPDEKLNGCGS
jgi:ribosomal protein L37AE/L43A